MVEVATLVAAIAVPIMVRTVAPTSPFTIRLAIKGIKAMARE